MENRVYQIRDLEGEKGERRTVSLNRFRQESTGRNHFLFMTNGLMIPMLLSILWVAKGRVCSDNYLAVFM